MRKYLAVIIVVLSLLLSSVVSYATPNPSVVIVNPVTSSTTYTNNILISIKITEPTTIRVGVYELKQEVNGVLTSITDTSTEINLNSENVKRVSVLPPANYSCSNSLSFFTKQVNEVTPGVYSIDVDTIDSKGTKLYTNNSVVMVKEKTESGEEKVFDAPQQTGTMQLLQNWIKAIFGN